jgi:hypothetical protein
MDAEVYLHEEYPHTDAHITVHRPCGLIIIRTIFDDLITDEIVEVSLRPLRAAVEIDPGARGLLITRGAPPNRNRRKLWSDGLLSARLKTVQWQGTEDNERLRTRFDQLYDDMR